MAMMLVMIVIASASVLSVALLASNGVQQQIARNGADQAQVTYLSESGLNLAVYYLEHPDRSPVQLQRGPFGGQFYPGESGVTLDGLSGAVDINVTNTGPDTYRIDVTARNAAAHNRRHQPPGDGYGVRPTPAADHSCGLAQQQRHHPEFNDNQRRRHHVRVHQHCFTG